MTEALPFPLPEGADPDAPADPEWTKRASEMMEKATQSIANKAEIDDFLGRADEIEKLITGLKDGTIDPKDIPDPANTVGPDGQEMCEGCYEVPFPPSRVPGATGPAPPPKEEEREDDKPESPRSAAIRRAREERWVPIPATKPPMYMPQRGADGGTDYNKWDEWGASQIAADPDEVEAPPPEAKGFLDALENDAKERSERRAKATKESDKWKEEGNAAFKEGKFSKAARKYGKAIDLTKDRTFLYTNRAQAYIKLGNFEDALIDLDKALRIDENFVKGYFHRAKVHRAQGKLDLVVEDYKAAAAADPKHTEVARLLAEAERDVEEKRAEDAVMEARRNADEDKAQAEAGAARAKELSEKGPAGLGLGPLPARKDPASSKAAPAASAPEAGLPRVDELVALASSAQGTELAAACGELAGILSGDGGEAARTYLRASGGIPKVVEMLRAGAAGGGGGAGAARARGGLEVLTAACKGDDANERAAAAAGAFAAAAALLGAGDTGRAAAAALGDLAASGPTARAQLATAPGAAAAAAGMVETSGDAAAVHHALGLLRNCAVEGGFREQLTAMEGGASRVVGLLAGQLGAAEHLTRAAAAGALGNLAADAALRGALLEESERVVVGLMALLGSRAGPSGLASADGAARASAVDLAAAVLGCFVNLTIDEAHAADFARQALSSGGLPLLLKLVEDAAPAVGPRAMGVLARCAKHKDFLAGIASSADATSVLARLVASSGDDTVVEAAVRLLASMSRAEGVRGRLVEDAALLGALITLLKQGTSSVVARRTPAQTASLAGNAALCLSEVARLPSAPKALRRAGAIPPLVDMMASSLGAGAKKNAAICLARMATEEKSIEKIRELQGIHMMHVLLNG